MAKAPAKKNTLTAKKTTKRATGPKGSKGKSGSPSLVGHLVKAVFPYLVFVGFIVGTSLIAKANLEKMDGIATPSYTIGNPEGISPSQRDSLVSAVQGALHGNERAYSPFNDALLEHVYHDVSSIPGVKEVHSVKRLYENNGGQLGAKLSISAEWRIPWVQVQNTRERFVWLDEEGFHLPGEENFRDEDTPLVTVKNGSFSTRSLEEERGMAPWSDPYLTQALSLLEYLQRPEISVPFGIRNVVVVFPPTSNRRALSAKTTASFTINTREGYGIRWGSYSDQDNSFVRHRREETLNAVRKLVIAHQGQLNRVAYFDVSAKGAETVTFK